MSLLELVHATKRFTSGQRELLALDDVSLALDRGEWVAASGLRRTGRTTLLHAAAGLLRLDGGEALFDGRDVAARTPRALGVEIGYCSPAFDVAHGGSVADHVAVALLARGAGRRHARVQAAAALERVGAGGCASFDPRELGGGELVRAGIARALVAGPRLLLLDEPASGVEPAEREALHALLRSLAADGLALLTTAAEPVMGVDRMLLLERGRLCDEPAGEQAPVVSLRSRPAGPVA